MDMITLALAKQYTNDMVELIGEGAHVYFKYADAMPTQDSEMYDEPTEATVYMGTYVGTSATAPTTYTSYDWLRVRGADGTDGQDADSVTIGSFENMVMDYRLRMPYSIWNQGYTNNKFDSAVEEEYTRISCLSPTGNDSYFIYLNLKQGHTYYVMFNYRIVSGSPALQLRLNAYNPSWVLLAGGSNVPNVAEFSNYQYKYTHTRADETVQLTIINTNTNALVYDISHIAVLDLTDTILSQESYTASYITENFVTGQQDFHDNVIYCDNKSKLDRCLTKTDYDYGTKYWTAKNTSVEDKNFLRTSGTEIVDKNGIPFVMRSMGLFNHASVVLSSTYSDIARMVNGVEGHDDATFRELVDAGFNSVRLYMRYDIFESPTSPVVDPTFQGLPSQYKESGFTFLQSQIDLCRKYDVKLLLNMHIYPGASVDDIDDTIWVDADARTRLINLWKAIATYCKNEDIVIGYGLINEPNITWNTDIATSMQIYEDLTEDIVTEIRKVDTNHIIFSESVIAVKNGGTTYTALNSYGNFVEVLNNGVTDTNYVYEAHMYNPMTVTHEASATKAQHHAYPKEYYVSGWGSMYEFADRLVKSNTWAAGSSDDTSWVTVATSIKTPVDTCVMIYPLFYVNYAVGTEVLRIDDFKINLYDSNDVFVKSIFVEDMQYSQLFNNGSVGTFTMSTDMGATTQGYMLLDPNAFSNNSSTLTYFNESQTLSQRLWIPDGYKYNIECKMKASGIDAVTQFKVVIGADEIYTDKVYTFDKTVFDYFLKQYKTTSDLRNVPLYVGEYGVRKNSYDVYEFGGDKWVADALEMFERYNISHNLHVYLDLAWSLSFALYPYMNDERLRNERLMDIFRRVYLGTVNTLDFDYLGLEV